MFVHLMLDCVHCSHLKFLLKDQITLVDKERQQGKTTGRRKDNKERHKESR